MFLLEIISWIVGSLEGTKLLSVYIERDGSALEAELEKRMIVEEFEDI